MVAKSQKRDITFSDTEDDAPTVKRKSKSQLNLHKRSKFLDE